MPNRGAGGVNYRYGFNGKETENDVKGVGNQVDFTGRIFDNRIGKFLSIDLMARSYASDGPYQFSGNTPISFTDFNGYFKISPFFAQRYPSLARVLEHYLPLLKDNEIIKGAWIRTIGFANYAEGEKAFNDMVTFGNGPWITPTRMQSELRSSAILRFIEPDSEGSFDERNFPENLAISLFRLNDLETALKGTDAVEIGTAMFIVSTVIMHEASHWGKWKYNCCENDYNPRYEMGSVFEFEAYGQRFSNKYNVKGPFDDNLAKNYYKSMRGAYGTSTFGLSINIQDDKFGYHRMIKFGPTSSGHLGDPTLKANGDKESFKNNSKKSLSKPYRQRNANSQSGADNSSQDNTYKPRKK